MSTKDAADPIGQQLQHAAATMIEAAETGRSVLVAFRRSCPGIFRQIDRDRRHPDLLAAWGSSVNLDEHAGQEIVHPAILSAIGVIAGVPMRRRVVHAGLQHAYGYLFSLIDTPFGAKRDRWVSTDLEEGFGLDRSLLGPQPRAGTLLGNLTQFLAPIVSRTDPRRRMAPRDVVVAREIADYDWASLRVCRIVERVHPVPGRTVELHTDLVRYPRKPRDGDGTLLIYSLWQPVRARRRLVTAFPVGDAMVEALFAAVPRAGRATVRLRYNAYLPGMLGRSYPGRRFVDPAAAQNWIASK